MIDSRDVIFCVRVSAVQSERIILVDQFNVSFAEFTVRTGIVDVPRELLANDMEDEGIFFCGKCIDAFLPHGNGKP